MAGFRNTRPTPSVCPKCGRVCLAAVSEGVRVRVDITALDPPWFVAAILRRVPLFWLDPIGLAYIDQYRMQSAGTNGYPVLPQHRCDILWPHQAIVRVVPQTDDAIPY
jgi:hypothetical protein